MEEWKAVPDYEGYYEVSDLGRVKTVGRIRGIDSMGRKIHTKERILKYSYDRINGKTYGYKKIYLSLCGKVRTFLVHVLVWKTFKGEIPRGYQIDHIDDNKSNPCLSNLQLLTPQDNRLKAVASSMDEQYHPEWGKQGSIAYNAGYAQALKDIKEITQCQ